MQLKYLKSYLSAQNELYKITALAWSTNNLKLACSTYDKIILLFDENGEKRDKFATKPSDVKAGKNSYSVKALAFSPDSTKLAVAQTDNMIFVYKIGDEWGEKKVICNKFLQSSAVTCTIWPSEGPLICGLADGKVRECILKVNKSRTLYTGNSMVVSLAINARGTGFLSGHADGTIARYYIAEDAIMETQGKLVIHPVAAYCLSWTNTGHVIAAGSDKRILIYTSEGNTSQTFDYSKDKNEKDFTCSCSSPSGQSVAIGSFDRIRILSWDTRRREWNMEMKEIRNLYSVTALSWRRDGSKLACGGLCGSIEIFESVLKRTVWRNKFEMIYVAPSQVLVRPLPATADARGVILRSRQGYEISDVRIAGRDEQFLVARTSHSLLLGDLSRNLLSEVPWLTPAGNIQEKFSFDNPTVCLIFHAGELTLVQYGNNNILASLRTEFMNPHLVSVRINERQCRNEDENKKLAYLLDLKTICIVDLVSGAVLGQISHDSKLNWLELSEPGDKLLFRDSKLRLWLIATETNTSLKPWYKIPLLPHCSFVQWVTGSDVVVAQSRSSLCVWYNLDTPDNATVVPIKGDVIQVTRDDGSTEVIVEEGRRQKIAYTLDEGLVEFGTALQDGDLERALRYLESTNNKNNDSESQESMWRALASLALERVELTIASKCYSNLGETARTFYLDKTIKMAQENGEKYGGNGLDSPNVLARLALLNKQFKLAEDIYIKAGDINGAIKMYENLYMFEEALAIAEVHGSNEERRLRDRLEKWLLETQQQDKAGEMREQEGLFTEAIEMYIKAGMPARAFRTLQEHYELMQDETIVSRVAHSLSKHGLSELAGDLWEKVGEKDKALDCYRSGGVFNRAVIIARSTKPNEVVILEAEWAEKLMSQRQFDSAISHFIEAGRTNKALEAAIKAGQWRKAQQIINVIDDKKSVKKYFVQLAGHFANEKDYTIAEKMYIEAGANNDVVKMYCDAAQWENAWRVAKSKLGEEEGIKILNIQAEKLEKSGQLREGEKLYLAIGEAEEAVEMYRRQRRYDDMCRLATSNLTSDQCKSLQQNVVLELQAAKAWRSAEKLLIRATEWKSAVAMYRAQSMWEDALRVARSEGGTQAWRHVAFLWALELGGISAVKLLERLGLLEQAIDHACDNYQFEFAFELCRLSFPSKLSDVHYKYALALEDDGKFSEAEDHFVKSGKPKEAVLMYMHSLEFDRALGVAEQYSPDDVNDILEAKARKALESNDLITFEALMLRAQRAELVVQHYKDTGNWSEAIRVCREHLPSKLAILEAQYQRETGQRNRNFGGDSGSLLNEAKKWEESGDHRRAIETLLKINSKNCGDLSVLAKSWLKAAEMSLKFLTEEDSMQIARSYGPELITMGQNSVAAQIYLGVDMVKEAVDALINAGDWGKARRIVQQLEPRLETYVENAHKSWLKQQGQADQLADLDVSAALEMLAHQAQWNKCRETAKQHGPHAVSIYLVLHANQLIRDGDSIQALSIFTDQLPIPTLDTRTLPTIKSLTLSILSMPGLTDSNAYHTWSNLRSILLQMVEDFEQVQELEQLLIIVHFYAIRSACRNIDTLETLCAKLSIVMLRYTNIIPIDKAYYEAAIDAKSVGWESEALVFLNHLLDIAEAIEEIEVGGAIPLLDSTDLSSTDFPLDTNIPTSLSVSQSLLEEAREWLLTVSMDQRIDQSLPLDERGVYGASLKCDGFPIAPMCIISGWPVITESVNIGTKIAIKEEWNRLLLASRVTRDSKLEDILKFLTTWCGSLPEGFAFGM